MFFLEENSKIKLHNELSNIEEENHKKLDQGYRYRPICYLQIMQNTDTSFNDLQHPKFISTSLSLSVNNIERVRFNRNCFKTMSWTYMIKLTIHTYFSWKPQNLFDSFEVQILATIMFPLLSQCFSVIFFL